MTPLSRLAAWLDAEEKLTDKISPAARFGVFAANGPAPEKDPHAEWKRIVYPEETEAIAALCISHPRLVRIARAMALCLRLDTEGTAKDELEARKELEKLINAELPEQRTEEER